MSSEETKYGTPVAVFPEAEGQELTESECLQLLRAGAILQDHRGDLWRGFGETLSFCTVPGPETWVPFLYSDPRLMRFAPFTIHTPVPGTKATEPTPAAPSESQLRKESPVFSGVMAYFPDTFLAMARLSRKGNEKHNPGQPMHWAFEKSKDHADCVARHLEDFDELDPETNELHVISVAWRACALAQTVLEKRDPELHTKRQAQRDRAAKGER